MKKSNISSKDIIKKQRIRITSLFVLLICFVFFIIMVVFITIQSNSLKNEAFNDIRNLVCESIENEINTPFSETTIPNNNIKYAQEIEIQNNQIEGFVVLKQGTVYLWLSGDESDDVNFYNTIENKEIDKNSYIEFQNDYHYIGIYSGYFYNNSMNQDKNSILTENKLSDDAIIYSAVDYSVQINNSRNMSMILMYVLIGTIIILTPFIFIFSKNIFLPTIKAIDKEKEFVANASHELKTPLAIISANASVVKEKHPEDINYIENITQQCKNMNETILDMIDLTKLEVVNPILTNVNVSNLLLNLALSFDALAYENGIEYLYKIDENLILEKADEKTLTKLFNLLIDNAMKYTEGSKKIIEIKLEKRKHGIHFSIYNTGCQVTNENRNKVFNRFYQGNSGSDNERKGSGLGLAIVKQICEKYNYSLEIDSEYNEYIMFNIDLH